MNPIFTKSFRSTVAITGHLIVKAGSNGIAAPATAATDALLGAAGSLGSPVNGLVDVAQTGWGEVRCGGTISFGDPLTANSASKAVKAVPTAGSVVRIIGYAMADGSADDIIPYNIALGVLATPAPAET